MPHSQRRTWSGRADKRPTAMCGSCRVLQRGTVVDNRLHVSSNPQPFAHLKGSVTLLRNRACCCCCCFEKLSTTATNTNTVGVTHHHNHHLLLPSFISNSTISSQESPSFLLLVDSRKSTKMEKEEATSNEWKRRKRFLGWEQVPRPTKSRQTPPRSAAAEESTSCTALRPSEQGQTRERTARHTCIHIHRDSRAYSTWSRNGGGVEQVIAKMGPTWAFVTYHTYPTGGS